MANFFKEKRDLENLDEFMRKLVNETACLLAVFQNAATNLAKVGKEDSNKENLIKITQKVREGICILSDLIHYATPLSYEEASKLKF
jgi:hypothetical protein